MKNKVTISPMTASVTRKEETKEFITESEARAFLSDWCNERGYELEPGDDEAGGIGHDYRVTLHE